MSYPYSLEQVEDAVIALLEPLKASLGVRTIKTYQGELEEADFKKMIVNFPAIFLVYGGSSYLDNGNRQVEMISVAMFVCDRSLRGETEARRGGTHNPGTYAMLRAIREIVLYALVMPEFMPAKIVREEPVFFGHGASVYSVEYEIGQLFLVQ